METRAFCGARYETSFNRRTGQALWGGVGRLIGTFSPDASLTITKLQIDPDFIVSILPIRDCYMTTPVE